MIPAMTTRFASVGLLMVLLLYGHADVGFAQREEILTWRVDGETRKATVHAPTASSPAGRAPLVLSFHGHGDTMNNFQYTDLHVAWPQAIVVYFQGLPSRDGLPGWQVEKGQDRDRDLKLVDAALTSIRQSFKVDDSRIYSTGFSNGASFTYLLWAERPSSFTAFAAVAARLRPSVVPKEPRPMLHIAGERDQTIPFAVQQRAIETARSVNGANAQTSCRERLHGLERRRSTGRDLDPPGWPRISGPDFGTDRQILSRARGPIVGALAAHALDYDNGCQSRHNTQSKGSP
jgi:poly(3-hydroxybutyrate) depolymerase